MPAVLAVMMYSKGTEHRLPAYKIWQL